MTAATSGSPGIAARIIHNLRDHGAGVVLNRICSWRTNFARVTTDTVPLSLTVGARRPEARQALAKIGERRHCFQ